MDTTKKLPPKSEAALRKIPSATSKTQKWSNAHASTLHSLVRRGLVKATRVSWPSSTAYSGFSWTHKFQRTAAGDATVAALDANAKSV